MDTGRLPAYRSSYLSRFHPYPRVKPSTRERMMAAAWEAENYRLFHSVTPLESDALHTLDHDIRGTEVYNETQQHLGMQSLVIELTLLFTKKLFLEKD